MSKPNALDRAKKFLNDEGFSEKMIAVAELVAASSDHHSLDRWVRWFKKLQPDDSMNVELSIIMLTFHKFGRSPKPKM